jgi:mycofactocin system glycosyltransferase
MGAAQARNQGAKEATGEILAFLDNDCVAEKNWLYELAGYFQWEELGAVGGYVDGYSASTALSRYEKIFSPLNLGRQMLSTGIYSRLYAPTCNLLVRKKVFHELGGLKESLHVGEDVDFCWRMQDHRYSMLYIPRGMVKHKHRAAYVPMLKRRYQYGTSEALLYKLHPARKKLLQAPLLPGLEIVALFFALLFLSAFPLILSFVLPVIESARKLHHLRRQKIQISYGRVILSVLRNSFSTLYSISYHLIRYYNIFFWLIGIYFHSVWLLSLCLTLIAASVDYAVRKPQLSYPVFLCNYILDNTAYQVGVFAGCLKTRNFGCYVPVVRQPAGHN